MQPEIEQVDSILAGAHKAINKVREAGVIENVSVFFLESAFMNMMNAVRNAGRMSGA